MANAIYPAFKEALLSSRTNANLISNSIQVALVDGATDGYVSTDDFQNDLAAQTAISATLTTPTVTNGTFDADSATFTAVSGSQSNALVLFVQTGDPATSRLIAYIDTSVTGLPVTPNGGDITVNWDASGIFTI